MNCASATMPASREQADRLLVLFDRRLLAEAVELQLRGGLRPQRDVQQAGLTVERQLFLVAQDVGDAGVDAPMHGEIARDELLAELR